MEFFSFFIKVFTLPCREICVSIKFQVPDIKFSKLLIYKFKSKDIFFTHSRLVLRLRKLKSVFRIFVTYRPGSWPVSTIILPVCLLVSSKTFFTISASSGGNTLNMLTGFDLHFSNILILRDDRSYSIQSSEEAFLSGTAVSCLYHIERIMRSVPLTCCS